MGQRGRGRAEERHEAIGRAGVTVGEGTRIGCARREPPIILAPPPLCAQSSSSSTRRRSFADAEQQYTSVLEAKRERCGAESAAVAGAHRDLGRVLALQRKFAASEEHYTAAVGGCSRLLGEAHPNTACALTDLAAVLREQGA